MSILPLAAKQKQLLKLSVRVFSPSLRNHELYLTNVHFSVLEMLAPLLTLHKQHNVISCF